MSQYIGKRCTGVYVTLSFGKLDDFSECHSLLSAAFVDVNIAATHAIEGTVRLCRAFVFWRSIDPQSYAFRQKAYIHTYV